MSSTTYRRGDPIAGTQYRFLRKIGEGGHGEVYEVEHTFLESRAVMKLLHGHHVARQQLTQRMTREAKTLAKLRHPHIVEVSDGGLTGEEPARPYFVMESLNGMPVRELLGYVKGGVGTLAAIRIVIGVLEALEHAHRAGVIHRDVKPDNIFLHRTSADVTVPKVLDFGIAHLLEGRRFTGNHFVGTPRYAAPEQLRGETPSAATDVYATGLVLFELLTGKPPFAEHKEIGALLQAHMHKALPAPSTLNPSIPPALDAAVARFTAKEPGARPASAYAGVVALREIMTRLEASEQGDILAKDFQTAPTPMENMMVGAQAHGASVVRELSHLVDSAEAARSTPPLDGPRTKREGAAAPDTLPLHEPAGGTMRLDAAIGYRATSLSPSDELPTPRRDSSPPSVDRNARTNTVMSDRSPAVPRVDTVVEPSQRTPTPAPALVPVVTQALPVAHRMQSVPSYTPPDPLPRPPAPPSRAKVLAASAMVLVSMCALGIPLALRYAPPRASAAAPSAPASSPSLAVIPPPPAAPPSTPPPSPCAVAPPPEPPPSARPPATAPTSPPARVQPRASAKPRPASPPKPIDPSSIPFD